MLERTVYICGVHSTGKSTIIEDLSQLPHFVIHPRSGHSRSNDYMEKLRYRIRIYHTDVLEQIEYERANPGKIILGDRAIYDGMAYINTFLRLGWIDDVGRGECVELFKSLFNQDLLPKNLVFVNPSLEWNIERLHERWNYEEKRWKEDDSDFIPLAHICFREKYSKIKGVRYINYLELKETDRKKRVDLILEFIREKGLMD